MLVILFAFQSNPSVFTVYDNVSEHCNEGNAFNFKRKQSLQFSLTIPISTLNKRVDQSVSTCSSTACFIL